MVEPRLDAVRESRLFRGVARLYAVVRTVSWSGESGAKPPVTTKQGRSGPVRILLGGLVTALRKGCIQIRLAFIVVTLVLLFLIEAISSPVAANRPTSNNSGETVSTGVKP